MAESKGTSRRAGHKDRPSDEVLIARARVNLALMWVVGLFVGFVGLGTFALMAVPLAHAIAGRHTDFGLTVSVSFNAALTATTALTGGGLILQSRRASRYRTRTRELERKLENRGKTESSTGAKSEESSAKG